MQALWIKTQSSPFEAPYFSCVPYLLGEGQAMQYSVWPKSNDADADTAPAAASAGRLSARRDGRRACEGDVEFDIRAAAADRSASDADREQRRALAGEAVAARIGRDVAHLRGRSSTRRRRLDFARALSYNPWHCIAEHRPLGNQSRARQRMYDELSKLRHSMNGVPHYEPTGTRSSTEE